MRQRVAVRRVLHAEVVALDHTGKTLALGGARHINLLTRLKALNRPLGADFKILIASGVQPELPQALTGLNAGPDVTPGHGTGYQSRTPAAAGDRKSVV